MEDVSLEDLMAQLQQAQEAKSTVRVGVCFLTVIGHWVPTEKKGDRCLSLLAVATVPA